MKVKVLINHKTKATFISKHELISDVILELIYAVKHVFKTYKFRILEIIHNED